MTHQTTPAPPDLAQHVAWLEQLLEPGHQLVHGSKDGWTLRKWDSYWSNGQPRMGWLAVANAQTLAALLARLGETHG